MKTRSKRAAAALASGLGLVALTVTYLTEPWEGTKNLAYYDRLGKVWTVCTGETKDVKQGDHYSDNECRAMLYRRLEIDFHRPLQRCIASFDVMPISVQAAMLDLSYNVGVGTVCNSTAAKRAKAKDWRGTCEAMTWFNRASGKVIQGLKNRRENGDAHRIGEQELCLEGIPG
jgi:lysozyme